MQTGQHKIALAVISVKFGNNIARVLDDQPTNMNKNETIFLCTNCNIQMKTFLSINYLSSAIKKCRMAKFIWAPVIGVARGGKGAMAPQKCLENIVILPFQWRFSKQNGDIRLKSNILLPPKILGWTRWLQ